MLVTCGMFLKIPEDLVLFERFQAHKQSKHLAFLSTDRKRRIIIQHWWSCFVSDIHWWSCVVSNIFADAVALWNFWNVSELMMVIVVSTKMIHLHKCPENRYNYQFLGHWLFCWWSMRINRTANVQEIDRQLTRQSCGLVLRAATTWHWPN